MDQSIEDDIEDSHPVTVPLNEQNINNACAIESNIEKGKDPVPVLVGDLYEDPISSTVTVTPNGRTLYTPIVSDAFKPQVNKVYAQWADVIIMYEAYAAKAGFSTRLGTTRKDKNGFVSSKYILCNRAGKPQGQMYDSNQSTSKSPTRRSTFKVTDCNACIRLKGFPGTDAFQLHTFIEDHNHALYKEYNMDLSKNRRKLNFGDQERIGKAKLANVGPIVLHRLQATLKGGHHMVTGTKTDYKNLSRDITQAIGNKDAQMIVNTLSDRVVHLENFFFDFRDFKGELVSLFWADSVAKSNYAVFGDVTAFDATYQTNKYNMIFVPFTGVDHHKKCVTFGAGLLKNESVEMFQWLCKVFLEAHGNKQPTLVLTDQDASMKQAVNNIFDKATHRLCMWHITQKLPAKVTGNLLNNTNLRREFHRLVWNVYIKPTTFETRWKALIEEYKLHDNKWLTDMYNIRQEWVPGYFKELPMCCLMKTTSRSESANHQFKVNSSATNTLVHFLLCFDSNIDGQRYNQRVLEHAKTTTTPLFRTDLQIERHAASVYTHTVFLEVQKEIYKCISLCYICDRDEGDGIQTYTVTHQDKQKVIQNEFTVTLDLSDNSITCSCKCYTRIGYLCRHAFCVLRHHNIEEIPCQYVHERWRKEALPVDVYSINHRYGVDRNPKSIKRNRILDNMMQCADRVRGDTEKLDWLDGIVQDIKAKIFQDIPDDPSYNNKRLVIEEILGQSIPEEVSYTVPEGIRNKGCGTNKRLIGPGEKAKVKAKKKRQMRLCNFCGVVNDEHDTRTCPKNPNKKIKKNQKKKKLQRKKTKLALTDEDTDEEEEELEEEVEIEDEDQEAVDVEEDDEA